MAVALKQKEFATAREAAAFAATSIAPAVTTIISIVFDTSSGKYVLFFT